MLKKNKRIKNAFTLAEILITLSIMGALMAMTIPTLMQSTNQNSYVNGLKKTYGLLDQATNQIMMNNSGTLINTFTSSSNAKTKYGNILEFNKTCAANSVIGNCWAASTKPLFGGAIQEGFNPETHEGAVLADGTLLLFDIQSNTCSVAGVSTNLPSGSTNNLCGFIVADVNGFSGPNQFGRDIYVFLLGSNGLYAGGDPHTQYNNLNLDCNISDTTHNGAGCANQVLNKQDIDY